MAGSGYNHELQIKLNKNNLKMIDELKLIYGNNSSVIVRNAIAEYWGKHVKDGVIKNKISN